MNEIAVLLSFLGLACVAAYAVFAIIGAVFGELRRQRERLSAWEAELRRGNQLQGRRVVFDEYGVRRGKDGEA